MSEYLQRRLASLPAPAARLVPHVLSFGIGLAAAVVVFYVLYRIGLPSKPFIYVAF